MLTRIWEPA